MPLLPVSGIRFEKCAELCVPFEKEGNMGTISVKHCKIIRREI